MNSMNVNSYKKIEMESASQGKLLLRLYDGAIDFIELARDNLDKKNIIEYRHYIGKVQAIVSELMSTLNMETGDVARNLFMLYEFMLRQLMEAYKNNKIDNAMHVSNLLKGLKEAFEIIVNGAVTSSTFEDVPEPVAQTHMPLAPRSPIGAYASAGGQKKSFDFSG